MERPGVRTKSSQAPPSRADVVVTSAGQLRKMYKALLRSCVLVAFISCHVAGMTEPCSRSFLSSTSELGVIHSYNYPFDYQDLLNCTYYIYVDRNDVTSAGRVCFRFWRFDLESGKDWLAIHEGSSTFQYSGYGEAMYEYNDPNRKHVWVEDFCFQARDDILQLTFISDTTLAKPGFYASFWTQTTHSRNAPTEPSRRSGFNDEAEQVIPNVTAPCFSEDQWTCFNRGCIHNDLLCDKANSCGDWSDEMYVHSRCDKGEFGPSIYGCDFGHGHRCRLTGIASPGWYLDSGIEEDNPDPDRIPASDHTVGRYSPNEQGRFYVRTVFGDVTDGIQSLGLTDQTVILYSNITYCLSFWYHMTGPRVGRLRVVLQPEADRPIWSRTANYSARWLHGEVLIGNRTDIAQVLFEGIRSHDCNATFALDDLNLSQDRPCYQDDISCTFEFDFCAWKNENDTFVIFSQLSDPGPKGDPVSRTGGERFAAVWETRPLTARLVSPVWGRPANGTHRACLQVWFYSSAPCGSFDVRTVSVHGERRLAASVRPGDDASWPPKTWKEHAIDVWSNAPFQIEIEAIICHSHSVEVVYVALDELVVVEDTCHLIELQSCVTDDFRCTDGSACIPMYRICDGYSDCPDGSDELTSACCYKNRCPAGYFCCKNGQCVRGGAACDGYNNCSDWSDEWDCPAECRPDQFACRDLSMCIAEEYRCNGEQDCPDLSDEEDCWISIHPAAFSAIVSVATIVLMIIVFRVSICAWRRSGRRHPRCCEADGEVTESGSDTCTDDGQYELPPYYQECVNNPMYPNPESAGKPDVATPSGSPPSYEQIQEGCYETLTVPGEQAMERLREKIMARFQADGGNPERPAGADGVRRDEPATNVGGLSATPTGLPGLEGQSPSTPGEGWSDSVTSGETESSYFENVPRYQDLIHPPAYDNLSFCVEDEEGIVCVSGRRSAEPSSPARRAASRSASGAERPPSDPEDVPDPDRRRPAVGGGADGVPAPGSGGTKRTAHERRQANAVVVRSGSDVRDPGENDAARRRATTVRPGIYQHESRRLTGKIQEQEAKRTDERADRRPPEVRRTAMAKSYSCSNIAGFQNEASTPPPPNPAGSRRPSPTPPGEWASAGVARSTPCLLLDASGPTSAGATYRPAGRLSGCRSVASLTLSVSSESAV